MLKIKDQTGKVVGVLRDDDTCPQMIAGEILPPVEEEEEEDKEGEEGDGDNADV